MRIAIALGLLLIAASPVLAQESVVRLAPSDKPVTAAQTATVQKLSQLSADFNAADANHDGKLSRQEFASSDLGKTAGANLEAVFQLRDADKDGFLSGPEFAVSEDHARAAAAKLAAKDSAPARKAPGVQSSAK